jgi:hypothetical protein
MFLIHNRVTIMLFNDFPFFPLYYYCSCGNNTDNYFVGNEYPSVAFKSILLLVIFGGL